MTHDEFINAMFAMGCAAVDHGRKINPIVMSAQAAIESAYGTSGLTTRARNLFGVKAKSPPSITMPTNEEKDGVVSKCFGQFRTYVSFQESVDDYCRIIENVNAYAAAASNPRDLENYIDVVAKSWATGQAYATSIRNVIRVYGTIFSSPPAKPDPSEFIKLSPPPLDATGDFQTVTGATWLRTEPGAMPDGTTPLLPLGTHVVKLEEAPNPAWWQVSTTFNSENMIGYLQRALLTQVHSGA